MKTTWQPTVAGILSICAGAIGVIFGLITGGFLFHLFFFLYPTIMLGIVAIIGGIFAIKREAWGLGLAGSICAVFVPVAGLLGIVAIILMALSKNEFKKVSYNSTNVTSQPS